MRIAKYLSHNGCCSRRKAEQLIAQQRVMINSQIVISPVTFVSDSDQVQVDNQLIVAGAAVKLWRYYKPLGLVTTHHDPQGRDTVFAHLPMPMKQMHIVSVGRLDLNSEGLLLLTNTPSLASYLEHPRNKFLRVYKVRAYGNTNLHKMQHELQQGITVASIRYLPINVKHLKCEGTNQWFELTLHEGKNREIRKIFAHFGLMVNRLIRIQFGPFQLGNLTAGEIVAIRDTEFLPYLQSPPIAE